MTCGICPSCKMDSLTDELQLNSLELRRRLVKAQYKLDMAKTDVELARLVGNEIDFCLAMAVKAKADAKVYEVLVEIAEFEAEAEAKYKLGLMEFLMSYFEAISLDIDLKSGMPPLVFAC